MGIIEDILKRTPNKPIYHYTSQTGLLGIVTNRCVWASNIQYLNDSQEFRYAIEIARNQIQQIASTGVATQQLINKLTRQLFQYDKQNVFVCSFSEKDDLLSQWRGYCPRGNGFSVGFDFNKLQPLMVNQGFIMAPCVYDVGTQEQIVFELITLTIKDFDNQLTIESINAKGKIDNAVISDLINNAIESFFSSFIIQAAIIKHPKFSEEAEWRMISPLLSNADPRIKFREGLSMLTPYLIVDLGKDNKSFPLFEIIVGPTPHQMLAKHSTSMFINTQNLAGVGIRVSDIPFRGW